ncbi:ferredoxin--NADP reductase [Corticibacter populi]|nr:FAD-dependent oxidoreductase [Corticibacter populi]RZS30794.1 ferredoxin-NADP reductase [Corticibacter populi]
MEDLDAFQVKVIATHEVAQDTLAVVLEKPAGFDYEAGQFVSVTIPGFTPTDEDDGERMLSLASAPHEPHLLLAMRMRDSAFKRHIAQLRPGDALTISPAMGDFVLPQDWQRPLVMVAGGIGITPFLGMLRHLGQRAAVAPLPRPVTLLYGNRNPASAAFREELQALRQTLPGCRVVHVFSEVPADAGAGAGGDDGSVFSGLITPELIRQVLPDCRDCHFFVVGPDVMVATLQDHLDACEVPPEQVTLEFFAGY